MQDIDFYAPQTLNELLTTLAETGGRLLAGGTDIIPQMRRGLPGSPVLVDATRIAELRFIRENDSVVEIGALSTHSDLTGSSLLQQKAPMLVDTTWHISSPQLRARGTLGGNIANASPAGDTIPALYAYKAVLNLVSLKGRRQLPIEEFYLGPGKTCLEAGEIIYSITFKPPQEPYGAAFRNMGRRWGLAISVVNTAALLIAADSGEIKEARVALGSVAPTVVRCPAVESALAGRKGSSEVAQNAASQVCNDIKPINDVRATAEYRLQAAVVLVQRALEASLDQIVRRTA